MQAQDVRSVYASGTAYSLTNSSAALDFGTTDPSLTLTQVGTWLILSRVVLKFTGATFAATKDVTLALKDSTSSTTIKSTVIPTGVTSTITGPLGNVVIPACLYTVTNDKAVLNLYGSVATTPSAGSLDASEAEIIAIRLF